MLGILGIYIEFSSPGLILPGVLGGILAILGLMALSVLPINWTGAMLLGLAIVFFVVEAMTPTNGILAAGGVIAMVLGAVILIETDVPELRIGWGPAIAVTLPFALISVFSTAVGHPLVPLQDGRRQQRHAQRNRRRQDRRRR